MIIRVYISAEPSIIEFAMLCDDCGTRRGRDWWRSKQVAPAGIDCDDCGACREATEAFQAALAEETEEKGEP